MGIEGDFPPDLLGSTKVPSESEVADAEGVRLSEMANILVQSFITQAIGLSALEKTPHLTIMVGYDALIYACAAYATMRNSEPLNSNDPRLITFREETRLASEKFLNHFAKIKLKPQG